ncbi:uncharacterized protein LOC143433108 isoform X2 [Xylocopa sonorina]|uniref:uncharacterized protein LOC143433108 isoform X2 n=1 Tax=Xylocopa sonorina TaxID=1818115 RepID=UPI00403AAF5A
MQSFPRMLKMLRENSSIKEKREALTYIRSNSKKLESTKTIKEEQYKELCKQVVDVFANGNNDVQSEAYETLNVIICEFKDHTLNLFEAMSQISQKHRLKILKLLEVVEDNAISTFAHDVHAVNFFNNCMCTIQTNTMPWTAPTACVDNLQALTDAENKPLSDDQRLEEETINYCINFLRRIYKVAAITSDIKVQRFNALLMDKVILLAYMGHKRQRGPALKLLQQALATDVLSHVRTKLATAWSRYITALQSTYCKRMLLLVSACEIDWATQWNVSIQFLGVDLHRGAGLINNLLSVEEKAFKSTDTITRRQAFLSWKLLVDNFALDPQELATARRIKLLCIPLNAKNSKTELIALTKLEVWWHVIIRLYKDISKFVNPVITQFLNFCFGPLGDTPLLSSKFDVVASPGKRFFKTKVVAVDALCQLLVTKQENHTVFSPILEERLPHSISDTVFQECYKSIMHSVGEALLVLSQLTDAEMKNRYQLGKILWTSLVNYVQESKMEDKGIMYKDMIRVITELANFAGDKPMIRDLILDIILFEIADLSEDFNFQDDTLSGLVFKLLQTSIFNKAEKNHYNALKCLFWHCIKSQKQNSYYFLAFNHIKEMHEKLCALLNAEDKNESVILELWLILADTLGKYMSDIQEINEGTTAEHNLNTVESIVTFPFMYIRVEDQKQVEELAEAWKYLYKQFEMRTDLITSVKSNEILLNIATVMQRYLEKNERSSCLIIHCLDIMLSTINYKLLLANTEVPSIVQLIVDLVIYLLSNKRSEECESALKALSAVIVTIYGQNSEKIVPYLQVCKPAIKLMLQSELEILHKEIASTWEIVVSIFKGLGKQMDHNLLLSYKTLIIQALNHPSLDIQIQTVSLFKLQNILSGKTKLILEEIEEESGKNEFEITEEENDQIRKLVNSGKVIDNFSKESPTSKLAVEESNESNKKVLFDSDSQDYVIIKTDLKFDVNRLTEHQKESLKRKREDIPALYNDLSQSSSQDTQNLQEWFDKKSKILEETEKGHNNKDNISIKNMLDDDANKENKIEVKELETINKLIVENDTKSTEIVGQNTSSEFVQKAKGNVDNNENSLVENQIVTVDKTFNGDEVLISADFVSNDSNSNSQEESSITKDDQRLSPSVLDNGKRRSRANTSQKLEEIASSQPGQSNTTKVLQRTLRTKVIQSKSETINKQKNLDNIENKSFKDDKRGTKRKSTLDSENDGTSVRQRRKTALVDMSKVDSNDSDSCKSTENDNGIINLEGIIDESNLSQRTRNEISRLRINMVFDSPLSTSRRSKNHEDNNKEIIVKKQSPDNRSSKFKIGDAKVGDAMKKTQKINDKELRSRGRTTKMKRTEKNIENKRTDDVTEHLQRDKKNESDESKKEESTKKEETIQSEVSTKGTSDDKCNLPNTKKITETNIKAICEDTSGSEIQTTNVDQNDEPKENEKQAENHVEDIIVDSQESKLHKLQKMNKIEQIIGVCKVKDTKNTLENKTMELEREMELEINKKEENVLIEDMKKCTKTSVETVDNDKLSNETQSANQDPKSTEGKVQTQDDMEDIIESSQELLELEKRCSEKQCYIKINKIENISPSTKSDQATVENEEVVKIVSSNCDNDNDEDPKDNVNESEEINEGTITGAKIVHPAIENNSCGNEKDVLEVQKVNDVSKSLLEFSSPKGNIKRQMKFKPYSGQGRAAHMLGLVTKQARMESEGLVISLDDEPAAKKLKCKDVENDGTLGKKDQGSTLKEIDKVTAACSSRQEKIFNNMRSADYCSSPSMKLFSNLKNDGEKIFSKTDKSIDSMNIQTDTQADKVGEETSILKRQRQSIPEPEPESVTPNKRKRVSFADPPVSEEIEYGIISTYSLFRANFFLRRLLMRKKSSLKLKHIKQKLVPTDSDKLKKDDDIDVTSTSEVDLQCERENELLTKIAEELEYSENITIDTDAQMSCSSMENEESNDVHVPINPCYKIKMDNLNCEVEITQNSTFSKQVDLTSINKADENKKDNILETSKSSNSTSLESTDFDVSVTQEDIFTGIGTEHNNYGKIREDNIDIDTSVVQDISITNNSLDSLKFNGEDESIMEHSLEKHVNSDNLEDTVDVANLTELNSSTNSEIFCERLIRTSTQATENIQEQDTLPVTDSVFGSLPLSQDSQNTNEFNAEIPHPELLDSTHPIYPALISCDEPITSVIDNLTNPLWVQHLSTHLTNRNVQTVGDLARLSEREVNRIPVKGNSKVEFVKSVLKSFEKTYVTKENLCDVSSNKIPSSVNNNVPASTLKATHQNQVLKTITNETQNTSTNYNVVSESSSSKFLNMSVIDESKINSIIPSESALQKTELPVSVSSAKPTVTITQIKNVSVSSAVVTVTTPENATGNSTSFVLNAIPITQKTKTVGTCTSSDSIYSPKAVTNKVTKSVAAQMALEDLLDEIDVNLVLESAARRCTPEKLLMQYKDKMRHVSQAELESETIKMLGVENRKNCNEVTLKAACRACGVNKVLLRLPDIFSADKQFFVKVLNAYRKKIKTSDCLNILNFNEIKEFVCQKCTSSELAEILSNKLKDEEQRGIREPMTELSSLDAMLKRLPMDVIISHTVANDELIPSRVVLDIALQNNSASDIVQALESQSSPVTKNVFDKLWSSQFAVEHINEYSDKEDLLKIFKAISLKFSKQDLLQVFYDCMNAKLMIKQEKD